MPYAFAYHEIITDKEGNPVDYRFLDANKGFEEATGLKLSKILGKTLLEVLPKTEKSWIESYGEVALKGKTIQGENYSAALSRHYRYNAFSPEKGKFVVMFVDITEVVKLKEEAEKANAKISLILDTSPALIWQTNNKGEGVFFNKAWEDFTGLKAKDCLGGKWSKVIFGDDEPLVHDKYYEAVKNHEAFDVVHRIHHAFGGYRWVRTKAKPYIEDGVMIGFLGTVIDINEEVEAKNEVQEQMVKIGKRNEDLEKMNQLMVDRELKMVDLKRTIETLKTK